MIDLAVAIPTLIGSILSMFAAGFIFICYLILPPQRHFRHTLILNLAAADFFNATNNTISGIYAITHKSIPPGLGCAFNGWIGQLTVQATDFSILFIAIATLITLRRSSYSPSMSSRKKLLISCGIWVVPLITSVTGLALNAYQPVSGNWCWLRSDSPALRYALGHAWRLTIIFTTIMLYTYIFIWLHRHFSSLRQIYNLNGTDGTTSGTVKHWSDPIEREEEEPSSRSAIHVYEEFEICEGPYEEDVWGEVTETVTTADTEERAGRNDWQAKFPAPLNDLEITHDLPLPTRPSSPIKLIAQTINPARSVPKSATCVQPLLTRDPLAIVRRQRQYGTTISVTSVPSSQPAPPRAKPPTLESINAQEHFVHKLLLLNAYPIGYVLLWIPGVANRFFELSGNHSRILSVLQASTQFVGLANAIVYGCNERVWEWWWMRKEGVEDMTFDEGETREVAGKGQVMISWPSHQS